MSSDGKPESRWFRLVYLLVVIGRKNLPYFLNQSVARFYLQLGPPRGFFHSIQEYSFPVSIIFWLLFYFWRKGGVPATKLVLCEISPSCYLWDLFPIRLPVRSGPSSLLFHSKIHSRSQSRGRVECIPFRRIPNATEKKKTSIIRWNDNKCLCKTNRNKPWRKEL